jgi:hypothetical protein
MIPPDSAEVFETETSKYWFVGDLLYIVTKHGPEPDLEIQKKRTEEFKQKLGGKKVCAIVDISHSSPSSKKAREYNTGELPKIFKAMAFVTKNPLSRMLANIYLGVKPLPFPVKMCSCEEEAHKWIQQYL